MDTSMPQRQRGRSNK